MTASPIVQQATLVLILAAGAGAVWYFSALAAEQMARTLDAICEFRVHQTTRKTMRRLEEQFSDERCERFWNAVASIREEVRTSPLPAVMADDEDARRYATVPDLLGDLG